MVSNYLDGLDRAARERARRASWTPEEREAHNARERISQRAARTRQRDAKRASCGEGYPRHHRSYAIADLEARGQGWCAFEALTRELSAACLGAFARPVDTDVLPLERPSPAL